MFNERSYKKELLDEENIPKERLYQNLKELEIINDLLGGHAISLKGLKKICLDKSQIYNIIDIGCGGGDSLKAIAQWSKRTGCNIHLTGIDLKPDCIVYMYDLATFYEHKEDTATAVRLTKKALALHPVAPEDFLYHEKLTNLLTRLES